ncbi:MAG: M48 family metallopeptidase [Pseudohongiellaceae bacterium]
MTSNSYPKVSAQWLGRDGSNIPAELEIAADNMLCARSANNEMLVASLSEVAVSPRLASIPRRIQFPNDVILVVDDNDFVDAALRRVNGMRGSLVLHRLERHWGWVMVLFIAALLVGWGVLNYGLPRAAEAIAVSTPESTVISLSADALDVMEGQGWLERSELPAEQRADARDLFNVLVSRYGGEQQGQYRILFRKMIFDWPNALALPDGTILVTDRLLELAEDDELTAVFVHEIGHVRERHGLRMMIQAAGAAGLGLLIFGDITGTLSLALLSAAYSREFEREADCFAYSTLSDIGIDWQVFGAILQKMEYDVRSDREGVRSDEEDADSDRGIETLFHFFSSHPNTEARSNPTRHCR